MTAHPVRLRGLGGAASPVILQRTDADFIGTTLDDLAAGDGLSRVLRSSASARDGNGRLKLYQPIQRTFHLILVEAFCDVYGAPRLDPDKIAGAGLVLRRHLWLGETGSSPQPSSRSPAPDPTRLSGWRSAGKTLRGWVPFQLEAEELMDPDPGLRPAGLRAGHPEIDRRLALLAGGEPLAEDAVPLFVAPPEICEGLGRTVLYGMIPLASGDRSAAPPTTYSVDDIVDAVSGYLNPVISQVVPLAGSVLGPTAPADLAGNSAFQTLLLGVQQAALQFRAFDGSVQGQALIALLNQHSLIMPGSSLRPMGNWLWDAARLWVLLEPGAASVTMPVSWPAAPASLRAGLLAAYRDRIQGALGQVQPDVGRYDESARIYRLRAFVRLREEEGCRRPPVWSDYSEPFTIAPWYDSSGVPPVRIELPDLSPDLLRKLKPNVAVAMPPSLFNLLNRLKLKDLADGKKPDGGGPAIQWICGFNLTIIFQVAFMVMFIFLIMFNLVFQWLMWVKICIPVPTRSVPPPPNP